MRPFFTVITLFTALAASAAPKEISIPETISEQFEFFEPSACIYLPELKQFLVASDDTNEADEPFLFLMNEKGELAEDPIRVKGLKKMTDIESIHQDTAGNLYLLSSLGLNKNGKEKPERNILAKAKRQGMDITIQEHIQLRPLLLEALEESSLSGQDIEGELDVEASFIKDGELIVGLKNPQLNSGMAMLFSLGTVENVLKGKLNLRPWLTVDFGAESDDADLLSDMTLSGDKLFMTTTTEEHTGRLWSYQISSKKLTLVKTFEGMSPEGITLYESGKKAMVVFDQGEESALFETIHLD